MHGMRGAPWADVAGAPDRMQTVEGFLLEGLGRCMGPRTRKEIAYF